MENFNYLKLNKINPDYPAVIWYENDQRREISYIELEKEITRRSCFFTEHLKIEPGDVIGVLAPRGPEYLINMLALWPINAVYLPLSDAWRESKALVNRLIQANARYLLTVKTTHDSYTDELSSLTQTTVVCMDENEFDQLNYLNNFDTTKNILENCAYIFSSSGTTGEPKLIALPHTGISDRIQDHIDLIGIKFGDGILGFIDFGFDASVVEMLLATCTGNTLYIADQTVRDQCHQEIPRFINAHNDAIKVAILLPSVLKGIYASQCPSLKKIVTMGEACLLNSLRDNGWFKTTNLYNGYGPTETTFGASLTPLLQTDLQPSIQRPMRGITLYLCNPETHKVLAKTDNGIWKKHSSIIHNDALEGEIVIGGNGIGTYLNLPKKNTEKFFIPSSEMAKDFNNERLFITGDTAKLEGSQLIYQYRIDNQIKRHGMLITLDEVETALKQCKIINDAIVLWRDNNLIAFITPKIPEIMQNTDIRIKCNEQLNEFISIKVERKLQPHTCFWINEIPEQKNQRNKFSRNIEDYRSQILQRGFPESYSTHDKQIIEISKIWQSLLENSLGEFENIKAIHYSINISFKYLGGDSLLTSIMIQKVWEFYKKVKTPVPHDFARVIVSNPTIHNIQQLISYYDYTFIKPLVPEQIQTSQLPIFLFPSQTFYKQKFKLLAKCLYIIEIPSQLIGVRPENKTLINLLKTSCKKYIPKFGACHFICDTSEVSQAKDLIGALQELGINCDLTITNEDLNSNIEEKLIIDLITWHLNQSHTLIANKINYTTNSFINDNDKKNSLINEDISDFIKNKNNQFPPFLIYWLIGNAYSGKTTLLKNSLKSNAINVLVLNVLGIKKHNIFCSALSNEFAEWQWEHLKKQPLVIVIEDYDAIDRLDCPDLLKQAREAGFTQVHFIISCRETYWSIYKNALLNFTANNLFIKLSSKISKHPIEFSNSKEINYQMLIAWFRSEYKRRKLDILQSGYIYQAFKTLYLLYKNYQNSSKQGISLNSHASHWENGEKLPCVHALPNLHAILPLLAIDDDLFATFPKAWKEEISFYYHEAEQAFTIVSNQTLNIKEIQQLQDKNLNIDFWKKFSNKDKARLHVLLLQYASGSIPIFIFHPLTGDIPRTYRLLAEALGPKQTIIALQMSDDDKQITIQAKTELYLNYLKQIHPQGPYVLMGWSFGAVLAYHMAILLEQEGLKVDLVINIDSPPPTHITNISMAVRALDMIDVLANSIYEIPLDLNQIKQPIPIEHTNNEIKTTRLYLERTIKYLANSSHDNTASFCKALEKAGINLQVYYDFANHYADLLNKLKAKYIVFEAGEKRAILNDIDFQQWEKYCDVLEVIKLNQKNHFTLFSIELFQKLKPELKKYQTQYHGTLSERLISYRQKRVNDFRKITHPIQSINITARADTEQQSKQSIWLDNAVEGFLTKQNSNCFLLLGDPGSGKSHYSRNLEYHLNTQHLQSYFPLIINLKPNGKDYLELALLEIGFTEEEYIQLKLRLEKRTESSTKIIKKIFGAPLLVIFDSYDEALTEENFYKMEQLDLWHAKAFINCRSYAVNLLNISKQFGDNASQVQTYYLQPFTATDIKNYLAAYEKNTNSTLNSDILKLLQDQNLIQTPLLLSIAVELWDELPHYRNRAELYQAFFKKLALQDQQKIQQAQGIRVGVNLERAITNYSQTHAIQYWQKTYSTDSQLNNSRTLLSDDYDIDTQQVIQANRLGIDAQGRLSHITFWEYHFATAIINKVLAQDLRELDTAYPNLLGEKLFTNNLSLLAMVQELTLLLKPVQSTLLKHNLLLMVYASRHHHINPALDTSIVTAAANSISLLNVMQVPFSGLDLRYIRVPNAYLKGALFDTTCLRNTDLSNTTFQNSLLRYADLRGADLSNIDFAEQSVFIFKNKGIVQAVASNRECTLLAAAIGNKIEIWDIQRNKYLFSYEYDVEVLTIVFSPNSKYLAFGGNDNLVCLWNIETQQIIQRYQLNSVELIRSIIFSPDDKSLFAAGRNYPKSHQQTILQWDITSGNLYAQYHMPISIILCLALSSDGKILAASGENKIYLWDIANRKKIIELTGHWSSIFSISFSPNNELLATGGVDQTVRLWNIAKQAQIAQFNNHTKIVNSVAFSPNGELLASGSHDKTVQIYDVQNCKLLGGHKEHKGMIESIFFTPDGKNLISSSNDNSVSIFNVSKLISKNINLINSVNCLKLDAIKWTSSTSEIYHPGKNIIAVVDRSTIQIIHHQEVEKVITIHIGNNTEKNCIAFFPNQPWLVSADSSIRIWDVNKGKCLDTCYIGTNSIEKIAINNEGIITTCDDKNIIQVFAPNRSLPWLQYQLIQQDHFYSCLKSDHILLDGCKISAANHKLLFNSLMANPWSYQLWPIDNEQVAHKYWPVQPYPVEILLGCLPEIFYPNILNRLSLKNWQILACVNKQMQQHFGYLFKLRQMLLGQVIPSWPSIIELNLFIPTPQGLNTELVDSKDVVRSLFWPSWFLQQLTPLRPIPVKKPRVVLENSHQSTWQLTFTETSSRRLVYLLSTTYLLTAALKKVIQMGLLHRLHRESISEYHFYHLCQGLGIVKLKQLLRFLDQHNIVIYDEINETLALTELGEALEVLAERSELERNILADKCRVYYHANSLSLIADNPLALVAIMYAMGTFANILHIWTRNHFFNHLEQPPLIFLNLEIFDNLTHQSNPSSYLKLFIECFNNLISTETGEIVAILNFSKFLGILLNFHFLKITKNGELYLTSLSEYLTSYHSETLLPVLEIPDEAWWKAVDHFHLGEQPSFEKINNHSFFKYLKNNPNSQAKFNQGLASLTHSQNENLATNIPIKFNNKIVDIAGGAGGFLKALQVIANAQNYNCQFTLYDQLAVITQVKSEESFQPANWHYVTGDFFAKYNQNNIPHDQDIYLIKGTLHDFNDENCLKILTHIREVMPMSSYLYVIERTLLANQQPNINAYGDLMMLMLLGGRGRYAYEWLKLFLQCGFEWVNESSPVVVEDHTIMVCRPKQLEISCNLRFFKSKKAQTKLASFERLLALAEQQDKELYNELINGFSHLNSEYHDGYINLLLQAIVCDREVFMSLPTLNIFNSNKYHLVFDTEYALIPVELELQQWSGLLIDKWRNRIFYFDMTQHEMPLWIKDFIEKISMLKPLALQIFSLNQAVNGLQLNSQSADTGPVLLALLANITHKICIEDLPFTKVETIDYLNCAVNMLAYDFINSPQALREQQLQWAISYLENKASQIFVSPRFN